VARVFKIKKDELLNEINKNHIFGKVKAHVHVIEYQKRGLPHMHLLIILDYDAKIRDIDKIDSIVCAEIPNKATHPELHKIVTKNMIHNPCGIKNGNPFSPCLENGKCTKEFPKEFIAKTRENVNGYHIYQRKDDGNKFTVRMKNGQGEVEVNNKWIVPYNPYLLLKFNCHINVEICSSVKSVKYLYKYIFKGHDSCNIRIHQEPTAGEGRPNQLIYDEIEQYVDSRYVSPPEAFWRLNQFPLHGKSHPIYRLAIHLPDQHNVIFEEGKEAEALEKDSITSLTAWFELNQKDPEANQYTYAELCDHYVFGPWDIITEDGKKIKKKMWRKRLRGTVIPRIYSVPPKNVEKFHLRMLLFHVRGAKSYEDIRTVDGILYDTFKGAAKARNLLEDDSEWEKALEEAENNAMAAQFREFFAYILVYCTPHNSEYLWQRFKETLSEDYAIRENLMGSPEEYALRDIEKILNSNGTCCTNFGLPAPITLQDNDDDEFDMALAEFEANEMVAKLNAGQRAAYDTILAAVHSPVLRPKGRCFLWMVQEGLEKHFFSIA